jgi:hypothetical protein
MTVRDQRTTRTLGPEEIRRLCGDILDWQVEAILETGADAEDLTEALAWYGGQDDVMGEERKPLSGAAGRIYDVLQAGEEPDEEDLAPDR